MPAHQLPHHHYAALVTRKGQIVASARSDLGEHAEAAALRRLKGQRGEPDTGGRAPHAEP